MVMYVVSLVSARATEAVSPVLSLVCISTREARVSFASPAAPLIVSLWR
jgi:hypothetical protein